MDRGLVSVPSGIFFATAACDLRLGRVLLPSRPRADPGELAALSVARLLLLDSFS